MELTYPAGAKGFVWAPQNYLVDGQKKIKAASGTFVFYPSNQNRLARSPRDLVFDNRITRRVKRVLKKTKRSRKNRSDT